jgi:hypothetical protein
MKISASSVPVASDATSSMVPTAIAGGGAQDTDPKLHRLLQMTNTTDTQMARDELHKANGNIDVAAISILTKCMKLPLPPDAMNKK